MKINEAKQILNDRGYELIDEGIFQGIKDRLGDRKLKKLNKKFGKSVDRINKTFGKDAKYDNAKTAEEAKRIQKIALVDFPKAIRGLRWGIDDDKAEEIVEKYSKLTNGLISITYLDGCYGTEKAPNGAIKSLWNAEHKKGTYYTDIFRNNIKEEMKELGTTDIEEFVYDNLFHQSLKGRTDDEWIEDAHTNESTIMESTDKLDMVIDAAEKLGYKTMWDDRTEDTLIIYDYDTKSDRIEYTLNYDELCVALADISGIEYMTDDSDPKSLVVWEK